MLNQSTLAASTPALSLLHIISDRAVRFGVSCAACMLKCSWLPSSCLSFCLSLGCHVALSFFRARQVVWAGRPGQLTANPRAPPVFLLQPQLTQKLPLELSQAVRTMRTIKNTPRKLTGSVADVPARRLLSWTQFGKIWRKLRQSKSQSARQVAAHLCPQTHRQHTGTTIPTVLLQLIHSPE